jgi:nicotinic acid phosphoribosyltransferase
MLEILTKLTEIEQDGVAIEECTKEELIDYISELKDSISNVITLVENRIIHYNTLEYLFNVQLKNK